MEVKMEIPDQEEPEVMEIPQESQELEEPENITIMRTVLQTVITSKSITRLKAAIDYFNKTLDQKMEYLPEIKDIYHYFCLISETAIDESNLNVLIPSLNIFYKRIIDLCYRWKCMSVQFEYNYRFYNFIKLMVKKVVIRLNQSNSLDNHIVINECIPQMLYAMIITVATMHGIKEVVVISKPITDAILRKTDLSLNTEEWKQLLLCMTYVSNAWKQINDIDLNNEQSLRQFIIYYLNMFLGENQLLSHISDKVIKCLAKEKNIDLDQLFINFQYDVSNYVTKLIEVKTNFDDLEQILSNSMSFFGIKSIPYEFLRHIIPVFVVRCDVKTKTFVNKFAEIDEKRAFDVIKMYLPDIIRHLFYSNSFHTIDEIEKVIKCLSQMFDSNIFYRIKYCSYDLVNATFLMLLSKDYKSTLKAIAFVQYLRSLKDMNIPEEQNKYRNLEYYLNNEEELKNDLKEFFLGFIHKFDNLMQDQSICINDKMIAIKSFVQLIEFMDKECVNTFRVKIFSTIKLIISERFYSNKDLIKLSIESMAVFVKRVDNSYLSSQLLTVCALILPLMHFWPNECAVIFRELIIAHKTNPLFKCWFKHLYFIPEINELKEVTEVIKPHITCGDSEEEICEKITLVVNNLNHENNKVQEFSLQELAKLLEIHQKLIYKKCHNTKEFDFDDFVNHIITQIMVCLKSTNEEVLLLSAECLGILGAIDPLRVNLEKVVISKEDNIEKFLNFNEPMFRITLIKRLYCAVSTATTTNIQYCASYALQEVIKIFASLNDGFKLENLLKENLKEEHDFCQLLTRTRYNAKIPSSSTPVIKLKPIFGSEPNMSYEEWLNAWITRLFECFIFDDKDKEEEDYKTIYSFSQNSNSDDLRLDLDLAQTLNQHSIKSKVLISCYQILIRNQSIAEFLLPYIVITALRNASPEQKQLIVDEFLVIITTLTGNDFEFVNDVGHSSSQTVFHIYDYLKLWHKNRIALHKSQCQRSSQRKMVRHKDREFKGVQFFLQGISNRDLAQLAYKCNAFSRSLRYMEEFIKFNENQFQNEIPFFQKLFIRLDEPDSVDGCNSKRCPNNPTINERILTHEAMGQMQEALICCEKAIGLYPNDFECQQKYLQISMDSFDQSAMVKTYGSGLIMDRPVWRPKLAPYVIEAVWRLGDWNYLDHLLKDYDVHALNSFGAGIGDLFCSMIKKRDLNEFEEIVYKLRTSVVGPLKAAANEISGYVRGHKYIVDLHILHDINHIYNKLMTELNEDICSIEILKSKFNEVIDISDQRIDLVRNTIKCQEPILNSQRALFAVLSKRESDLLPLIRREEFKSWLKSTKTARKSGNIQRSYNCLLEMNKIRDLLPLEDGTDGCISHIENCEAIIESAKIQWSKNNNIGAIQYLKNEIERYYWSSLEFSYKKAVNSLSERFTSDELNEIRNSLSFGSSSQAGGLLQSLSNSSGSEEDLPNEGFAKLQLLYAKYCDRSGVLDQNSLAVLYRSVRVAAPEWEESHYNLAMYYHKILMNYEESKKDNKAFSLGKPEEILEIKGNIVKSLVESLKYGVKHSHDSLPLMFNIWLDLGTDYMTGYKSKNSSMAEEVRKTVEKMNFAINSLVANAPLFIYFPSFALISGRVLHPYGGIALILKRILVRLVIRFPNQSMWLLLRSIHSQNLNRKNVFKEILSQAVSQSNQEPNQRSLNKFVNDMLKFSKHMTNLCQKGSDNKIKMNSRVKEMSLKKDFTEMAKLFAKNSDFSPILLPFRLLVNVTLPKSFYEQDYNPFPSKDVYIRNIDDKIDLLHSLQRPKKIVIYGTDGKEYTLLCKMGDDLRKDNCLIEFCNLLNRCFKRDADSRRRQLKVKTYLVISLSDNCGLIEWIPGLSPFKSLVEEQYRLTCDYESLRLLVQNPSKWPNPSNYSNADRIRIFQNDILPKFKPSVLGNWFASTYTDPLSWFSARQAFTRSSAVFSVVGYLLGLGDRHGENILIEELTGETVHVDLNCMFNKGEEFAVPERVPFRLTHNMVHAMGITEYEGTFRKACEHTLRIARDNKEALLNFVSPLRYDHLFEWSKTNSQIKSTQSEQTLDQAERIVFNIEARLKGIPSRNDRNLPKGIPLSVEGQVDHIIKESTDINNLGLMYVGWGPYL